MSTESSGERSRRSLIEFVIRFSAVFVVFTLADIIRAHSPYNVHSLFFSFTAQSPSSSGESNDDDDKDSKSEDESDSSDDTFVKENYYSSSSVWRSYTTRGQVKGNKEGELVASLGAVKFGGILKTDHVREQY